MANERSTVKVQNSGQNEYWIWFSAQLLKCQQFSNWNMFLNGTRSSQICLFELKMNKNVFYVVVMLMTSTILIEFEKKTFICSIKILFYFILKPNRWNHSHLRHHAYFQNAHFFADFWQKFCHRTLSKYYVQLQCFMPISYQNIFILILDFQFSDS